MQNIVDTFDDVENFIDTVNKIKDEVPDFDGKFWCEDYLMDILNLCEEWIEAHQEEYCRIRQSEIDELNYEFEKSRL